MIEFLIAASFVVGMFGFTLFLIQLIEGVIKHVKKYL
jgi:nitrate reductase NapE component